MVENQEAERGREPRTKKKSEVENQDAERGREPRRAEISTMNGQFDPLCLGKGLGSGGQTVKLPVCHRGAFKLKQHQGAALDERTSGEVEAGCKGTRPQVGLYNTWVSVCNIKTQRTVIGMSC